MKKSEFKKLKVGDTVQLRTLDELKQLKCYDESKNGIIDDNGSVHDFIINMYPHLLGRLFKVVERNGNDMTIAAYRFYTCHVVRQHLKGRE